MSKINEDNELFRTIIEGEYPEPYHGEVVENSHQRQITESDIPDNKNTLYTMRVRRYKPTSGLCSVRAYKIHFQAGDRRKHGINGFYNEEVITVLIDRLTEQNKLYHSEFSAMAIEALKSANTLLACRHASVQDNRKALHHLLDAAIHQANELTDIINRTFNSAV